MRKDAGAGDWTLPFVTVVMPTRNEARSIATSLASVLCQDYPSDRLEVIVADGMSDDRTRGVIDTVVDAAGPDAPPVTIIDNPGRIAATGLNAAIAKAQGDVIVRVDGHCEVGSDHVTTCVQLLEQTGADNVGGVIVGGGSSVLQRAVGLGTSSPFGVGNARFRYATEPGWADTVYPGAWPRTVLDRVGGFDEELIRNQDDELNLRIVQAGGRVWLDPRIRTRYKPRDSLAGLWRQYFDYGFHKVRVIQKRRTIASARHVVPPMFVLSVLTVAATAAITRRPKLLLLVAAPYATATFAASLHAARSDPDVLPVLPAVFVTLHVSYGAGFLAGLWRWRHGFRGWRSRTA